MSLRELIKAVERGDEDAVEKAARAIRSASLDRGEVSWIDVHGVAKAFNGSLDAAKALHDALLPGWRVANIGQRYGAHDDPHDAWRVWLVAPNYLDTCVQEDAIAITPARAWLLAILRAMEAEGAQ